jgi:hypothetical protein
MPSHGAGCPPHSLVFISRVKIFAKYLWPQNGISAKYSALSPKKLYIEVNSAARGN